jgi:ketosteroid isomerase-like protein
MAESQNMAAVRRFTDAFNRHDFDSLMADLDPDVQLHEWPAAPGAQTYGGREGLLSAIESWFESWEWMQVEIEDLEEADGRVLVTSHQRARGKGSEVEVEIRSWNVYSFENGKLNDIALFTDRDDALEAFRR